MQNVNDKNKSPAFKEMNYKLAQKAIMNYLKKENKRKGKKVIQN